MIYESGKQKRRNFCNPGAASIVETATVAAIGFHSIATATGPSTVARENLLCRCPCSSRVVLYQPATRTNNFFLLCGKTVFIESFKKNGTKVPLYFQLGRAGITLFSTWTSRHQISIPFFT